MQHSSYCLSTLVSDLNNPSGTVNTSDTLNLPCFSINYQLHTNIEMEPNDPLTVMGRDVRSSGNPKNFKLILGQYNFRFLVLSTPNNAQTLSTKTGSP